jgi:acyl-coenzyme A thioesterase PaaI-like protein
MTNVMENFEEWSLNVPQGKLATPGHPPFDLLEIERWNILRDEEGELDVECYLPPSALNPLGQLFGGFTAAYVDIISLYTAKRDCGDRLGFQSTINMRIDYFEPILNKTFTAQGRIVNRRGDNRLISTRLLQDGNSCVFALTTMRHMRT